MRRRTRRRLIVLLLVVAGVLAHRAFGDRIRDLVGLPGGVTLPERGEHLRVATWNLHNFPGDDHDVALLQRRLRELDADVIAVQEVRNGDALAGLLPGWEVHLSRRGGRAGQALGIAFDPARVELVGAPSEHRALSLGGRLRPAYHAYVRGRAGGPDLHVVVVHLKAFPDGIDQRRRQWKLLAELVLKVTEGGDRDGDADVIVLGDFNTTGPEGGTVVDELHALDAALGTVGLRRLEPPRPCSAYWDGTRRDAWKEPSLLDHMFVADLDEAKGAIVEPAGICARHACDAFRSTEAYPEADYATVSDHCPLVLDLPREDDD